MFCRDGTETSRDILVLTYFHIHHLTGNKIPFDCFDVCLVVSRPFQSWNGCHTCAKFHLIVLVSVWSLVALFKVGMVAILALRPIKPRCFNWLPVNGSQSGCQSMAVSLAASQWQSVWLPLTIAAHRSDSSNTAVIQLTGNRRDDVILAARRLSVQRQHSRHPAHGQYI